MRGVIYFQEYTSLKDSQEYSAKLANATLLNIKWIEETDDPDLASTCLDAIEEITSQILKMIPEEKIIDKRTIRQKIRDGEVPHEKLEEMGVL